VLFFYKKVIFIEISAHNMNEFSSGYALPAGRNSTGCRESSCEAGRQRRAHSHALHTVPAVVCFEF
jgi:hypothetical protein